MAEDKKKSRLLGNVNDKQEIVYYLWSTLQDRFVAMRLSVSLLEAANAAGQQQQQEKKGQPSFSWSNMLRKRRASSQGGTAIFLDKKTIFIYW